MEIDRQFEITPGCCIKMQGIVAALHVERLNVRQGSLLGFAYVL